MIAGVDVNVAESALTALFGQSLAEHEIVRLAELVLSGRTALALDNRILRLIVTRKREIGGAPVRLVEDAVHFLLTRLELPSRVTEKHFESVSDATDEHLAVLRDASTPVHRSGLRATSAPPPSREPERRESGEREREERREQERRESGEQASQEPRGHESGALMAVTAGAPVVPLAIIR
jgi:hypothetical protein